MTVTQVYTYVNDALKQTLGETAVLQEDLSNIVEVGRMLFDAEATDLYTKHLINRIGKEVYVSRTLANMAPNVMREGWEFGGIKMKVSTDLPEATVNQSWELRDGASYDDHIFHATPPIRVTYYNKRVTLEYDHSIPDIQLKQSFTSAAAMGAFLAMISTAIDNAFAVATHNLIMAGYRSMIGDTIADDYGSDPLASKSGVKAVNVLHLYNQLLDTPITAADAMRNQGFLRYASYTIKRYLSRIKTPSKLYNIAGADRWTSADRTKIVMLSDFAAAADVYLYNASGQFLTEGIKLPQAEIINAWQGSGTDADFYAVSRIDVVTASGNTVEANGVLAVIHDDEALVAANENRRTLVSRTESAEFATYYHKLDLEVLQDPSENCIVFFAA